MTFTIQPERISALEYIDFLKTTDLGRQYPRERFETRIEKLVQTASISLIARDEAGAIAGVLFGLTDFAYWLFVTDLGVRRDCQRMGLGAQLMRKAHALAGGEKNINVYLAANDDAIAFYEKLGMKKSEDVMEYCRAEWTRFEVKKNIRLPHCEKGGLI